jgi:hypothetical protein
MHKRQPNRLKVLDFIMSQLDKVFISYRNYRNNLIYRLNVSGETGSLQAHLNRVIDNANNSILIQHEKDTGISVQLRSEGGDNTIKIGKVTNPVKIALRGEVVSHFDTSFIVRIPAGVNKNKVTAIVNEYRLAGKSFKIIEGK